MTYAPPLAAADALGEADFGAEATVEVGVAEGTHTAPFFTHSTRPSISCSVSLPSFGIFSAPLSPPASVPGKRATRGPKRRRARGGQVLSRNPGSIDAQAHAAPAASAPSCPGSAAATAGKTGGENAGRADSDCATEA